MNKGIPGIFDRQGVACFYQDMISPNSREQKNVEPLLEAFHWNYSAEILETAAAVAEMDGVYPVFITSFKCTPDSYAVEYVKKILDAHDKPYLILQLDEHDSSVGYETRIEAGIRSFRNHYGEKREQAEVTWDTVNPIVTRKAKVLEEKIVLLPQWDATVGELMVATLRREGVDARLLEETPDSIQRSLSHNTGQCIPLNVIAQNCVEYIEKYNLDPGKVVLWNIDSRISCNIGMFPFFSKSLLESYGKGMEKVEVYTGGVTFWDFSLRTAINMYLAYMFGGLLKKMVCRVRPYETLPGATDRALAESLVILSTAFEHATSKEVALEQSIKLFEGIATREETRPKVAIFGDLYVRDNDVMNQDIIRVIEANGGEALTTPYSELMKVIAEPYIRKWYSEGIYGEAMTAQVLFRSINVLERRYYHYFNRILKEPLHREFEKPETILERYNLKIEHTGESMENALKIISLIETYPDIALFVQTNPAFCCPSLVTEAMAQHIEKLTGVPIVTIEYDGTGGMKNDDIIPYLAFPREVEV